MEQVSSTPSANYNETKPGGSTNSAYKITLRKIARAAVAEINVHKKIAIISYVLFGVSMLLFMFNAHYYSAREGTSFMPSGWGAAFSIMGIIVGIFAALNVFRDVNNQQLCDVTMALPIKATERFLSKLLALFLLQTAPLIIAALGGNGVALLFGRINSGPLDPEVLEYLALIVFGELSSSLFIMAITVLCTCCCGAPAESAYFSIILMFVINALPLTFINHIIAESSGFGGSWLYGGSGIGIDVSFWGFLPVFVDYSSKGIGDFIFHNVISIALSLCVMFLSIFIYKKRDAKTVGTPIASRVFFEAIMALGCFTIFSFSVMTSWAFWGVLIAGVAYIIINVIVSRAKINAMSFFRWIVKYAATLAVFAVFMVVTIKTGGFGQIYSRPAAKYLDGAEFRIVCYDFSKHNNNIWYVGEDLTEEQADMVMEICKKHIVKGRNEVPAIDIMTESGNLYGSSTARVYISAQANTKYSFRPAPGRHFERHSVYDKMTGIRRIYYTLDYTQHIMISVDEWNALRAELRELDYINEINQNRN